MLVKFAKAQILDVRSAPSRVRAASLNKFADFNEYRTDDGYVYVRVRAISSRVNKNHDGWPSDELKKAYRTFIGKPIFVDHHNSDPTKARGVIVDAALHIEDAKTASSLDPYYASDTVDPSHLPPTWIELLLEVDAKKFPKLAKAIVNGDIDGVSMGANVESSECSHCGNVATTPEEFCKHVLSKGAYFDYIAPNGQKVSKKSYENCHKIAFFEISFVFDPADETALVSEVKHTARREIVAAIQHEADTVRDWPTHDTWKCQNCKSYNDSEDSSCFECGTQKGKKKPVKAALGLEDSGMTNDPVPDPPVDYMETGRVPQAGKPEQVFSWRLQQLLQAGVPRQLAERAAADPEIDYHDIINQMERGATPDQAVGIYAKTANTKTAEYKYVKQHGDKWVIVQKGTGKVLSEHDSEEKAKASFRAMEMHKHEGTKTAAPDATNKGQNPEPQNMLTSRPEKVNTLRQEQICPICGSDMDEGECDVCNYVEPPEGFNNPDLSKAHEQDEKQEQAAAEQAAQEEQAMQSGAPGGLGGVPGSPPMPGGTPGMGMSGSPALASFFHMPTNLTSPEPVMVERVSATQGRIHTQERPILPATRQLSDKAIGQKVIQKAEKPVESKTKENMTQTQKTADGVTPGSPEFNADKRVDVLGIGGVDSDTAADKQVDVLGVGAVSGDPLSDIEHENVEKNTGDFVAPHTDTWSGGEGDSLGQQEPVTSDTGDFFTVSNVIKQYGDKFALVEKGTGKVIKIADSSADLGGPIGEGIGNGGSASQGGSTWDAPGNGFPDHQPTRVDLNAPLAEEVGANTMTDPNEKFRSLKHTEPITNENANELGGPIGVAVASARAIWSKAFKLAETEIDLGITDAEAKYDRVAELEGHSEEALDAQLATLAKVRTAGLKRSASIQKTAGRLPSLPSLRNITASGIDIEANSVSDADVADSLF